MLGVSTPEIDDFLIDAGLTHGPCLSVRIDAGDRRTGFISIRLVVVNRFTDRKADRFEIRETLVATGAACTRLHKQRGRRHKQRNRDDQKRTFRHQQQTAFHT